MAAPRLQVRSETALERLALESRPALAISADPGTYILLLQLPMPARVVIGRRRCFALEAGLYAYVGSALGPGGLRARLRRHASRPSRTHWHVDRLTPLTRLEGALIREDPHRLECVWARWVDRESRSCVRGFGSCDCACPGHLFLLGQVSEGTGFVDAAVDALAARHVARELLLKTAVG